jgi:hypothetical protein
VRAGRCFCSLVSHCHLALRSSCQRLRGRSWSPRARRPDTSRRRAGGPKAEVDPPAAPHPPSTAAAGPMRQVVRFAIWSSVRRGTGEPGSTLPEPRRRPWFATPRSSNLDHAPPGVRTLVGGLVNETLFTTKVGQPGKRRGDHRPDVPRSARQGRCVDSCSSSAACRSRTTYDHPVRSTCPGSTPFGRLTSVVGCRDEPPDREGPASACARGEQDVPSGRDLVVRGEVQPDAQRPALGRAEVGSRSRSGAAPAPSVVSIRAGG